MDDGGAQPDGTVGTDAEPTDSTVPTNDAPVGTDDGSTPESGMPEGGTPEASIPDGGDGHTCDGGGDGGDCLSGHCVNGICCASACNTPPACRAVTGATCADGTTCVYPNSMPDTSSCNDNNACTVGDTCMSGQCVGTALNCNDGNPCTDDSCDMVLGCKNQNNTATCSDGDPCTTGDTCSGGLCQGTPVDCSGAAYNDQCNVGVCSGGSCVKSPTSKAGTACNDGNACTTNDVCTGGACSGTPNACGPNATGCTNGTPPTCACATNYTNSNGTCVATGGACASNPSPCTAVATCTNQTAAPGYQCTCPPGFTGDGTTAGGCRNTSCDGNPCGANGTCVLGNNTHTCNCNAGSVSVNGVCVCDMNGTFAMQTSLTTTWPEIDLNVGGTSVPAFAAGTNVPTTQWAIRQQTYDSTGQLVITTTQCGGTTADLCGISALDAHAYTEFLPSTIYDDHTLDGGAANMPVQSLTISLPNAQQGQPYIEPQSAALLGISLTNPLGAWPASNANVGVNASGGQTNGAQWVDNDNDGISGVTSYSVPVGGIAQGTSPFPIQTYAATSTQCSAEAPNNAYALLLNVKRLYSASRTISSMSGTISTCDSTGATLIQGTLAGPDPVGNMPKADARVFGCVVSTGGTGETNCGASTVSSFDGQNQTQHISSASFIIKRVASNVTCDQVRAMTFP